MVKDGLEIGEGGKRLADSHSPCFAQTSRTCASVANSPRTAAARDSSTASSSRGVEYYHGLILSRQLEQQAGNVVLRLGGQVADPLNGMIKQLCHSLL